MAYPPGCHPVELTRRYRDGIQLAYWQGEAARLRAENDLLRCTVKTFAREDFHWFPRSIIKEESEALRELL